MKDFVALARPAHWVKNVFVLAPAFFVPRIWSEDKLVADLGLAFLAFCLAASAIYVLNDLIDRDRDRHHPTKLSRPLARGAVSPTAAIVYALALATASAAIAWRLPQMFGALLLAYAVLNVAYSTWLKNVPIVDVLAIALGFVFRVDGGAFAIGVTPTAWITIVAGLLALFLALAKRRDDVVKSIGAAHRPALDGYSKPFLDAAIGVVLAALLISYAIYTADPHLAERLGTDKAYVTIPSVVLGILRYLQIAMVDEASGSPVDVILRDRLMQIACASWLAIFGALLYLR
jgi:4-hydroxybenzoate polyprenyltransferase